MTYERQFFQYLENMKRRIYAQPLNLGGVSSSGGGVGGPPGGFLGKLPQSKVTFDKLEEGRSGTVASGASLLDNLNHIRRRLTNVEASGAFASSFQLQEDDVVIASGVQTINFEGNVSLIDEGSKKVTVTISGGGTDADAIHVNVDDEIINIAEKTVPVSADIIVIEDSEASYAKKKVQITNLPAGSATFLDLTDVDESSYAGHDGFSVVVNGAEDGLEFVLVSGSDAGYYYVREEVTSQIPDGSDNFDLQNTPASGAIVVHYNGLTQSPANYSIIEDGVHTEFSPVAGDELLVEYFYDTAGVGIVNPNITVISGSTTINSVNTLNIVGMTVIDDGGGQVTISGSTAASEGAGTATGSFWSADAAPSTPSAYDDEFSDESVDAKWTEFDEIGGLTYSEEKYGLTWTGHSSSNYVQGIYQEVPAYQGWSIMCKVSVIYKQHDDNKCGLMLLEDVANLSTSDVCILSFASGGGGVGFQAEKFNAYNSYLGNIGSMSSDKWITTMYLRIRATSDNWYFDWSNDGIGWYEKDDWYPGGVDQSKLWEPEGFGLFVRGNNTNCRFFVHWFRYSTNTGYDVVEGNRINYYEAT